jgi:membrane protein
VKRRFRSPKLAWLQRLKRTYAFAIAWRAWQDYSRDDGAIFAAAVTYYVLLSLFPFMIFLASIFGVLVRDPELQNRVVNQIIAQMPSGVNLDEQIRNAVASVANTNTSLIGLIGILGSAWAASGVFGALRRALNNAFDVPTRRSLVRGRLHDLAGLAAVVLLLLVSAALTTTLAIVRARADNVFDNVAARLLWTVVFFCVPLVISFAVFLLAYRFIPDHTLEIEELWIGALIAAVGFEIAKIGFSQYLAHFANYDKVYGTLGGMIAFLVFAYLIAILTIIAADVNSELAQDRHARRQEALEADIEAARPLHHAAEVEDAL